MSEDVLTPEEREIARAWMLAALNHAWLHGHRYAKRAPLGRGDMTAILDEAEAALGEHPLLSTIRREREARRKAEADLSDHDSRYTTWALIDVIATECGTQRPATLPTGKSPADVVRDAVRAALSSVHNSAIEEAVRECKKMDLPVVASVIRALKRPT